jgi:hypothetical protein
VLKGRSTDDMARDVVVDEDNDDAPPRKLVTKNDDAG